MDARSVVSLLPLLILFSACAPQGGFAPLAGWDASAAKSSTLNGSSGSLGDSTPLKTPLKTPPATPLNGSSPFGASTLKICSKLAFPVRIDWPSALSLTDRDALKLAMNISGSFEGSTGWANLTNDFDGEGLSMGLLNQTLGTGSLEPLLSQMQTTYPTALTNSMSTANATDLVDMIEEWQGTNAVSAKPLPSDADEDDGAPLSKLDIDTRTNMQEKTAADRNSVASQWARNTLYNSSGAFVTAWSKDLTTMTNTAEYISLQIGAATSIHARALSYQKLLGTKTLRSYLFFFDVVVQNGSFYAADLTDYATWLKSNAAADEATRLGELLALRLRHVRTEYVTDVQTRKQAIIDGKGTVHGASRKFETEYCFDRLATYGN